ncbi:rhodanese-like domain-containing protein [Hyphomicrobium sp.]|uniref:rhodanese-like domain-containing protein n=1 Tax=Hyphomicrobium sp. TaxID=82 RepID=UPI002E369E82|nr:rhodanese-like domain-containing protein [Hyphomicrobium sp.]HEX2841249.1 rhodanese-like domain-containing protein [Hyphomicrobium sp.]
MIKRSGVVLAMAALVSGLPTVAVASSDVPAAKHTVLGKYLSSKEAYERITGDRAKILFLDVRTGGELMFVGGTNETDAVVPFVEMKEPVAWDDKSGRFQLVPNASFVTAVDAARNKKSLSKTDMVMVMCRSGERSAKAVNALAATGYTNVWSVHDGFEGDLSKEGRRTLNGWKNASLPWSYKLDKSKFLIGFGLGN